MTLEGSTTGCQTVTITLRVETTEAGEEIGIIETEPDPAFVSRGERVEWTFDDGPWVVRPKPQSPLRQIVIRGGEGETSGATVRDDAMLGEYKTLIAVFDKEKGKVFAADPHFVVE